MRCAFFVVLITVLHALISCSKSASERDGLSSDVLGEHFKVEAMGSKPQESHSWFFEGEGKPYPKFTSDTVFHMGRSFKSEASYLLQKVKSVPKNCKIEFEFMIRAISGRPDFVAMETSKQPNSGTVGIIVLGDYNDEHGRFWHTNRINL